MDGLLIYRYKGTVRVVRVYGYELRKRINSITLFPFCPYVLLRRSNGQYGQLQKIKFKKQHVQPRQPVHLTNQKEQSVNGCLKWTLVLQQSKKVIQIINY
jgi:hypothetical protein